MTIKTDVRHIMDSQGSLQILGMTDIPAPLSYRVAKLARKADSTARDFIIERDKLMKKYDVKLDEKSRQFIYPDKEKREQFDEELDALLAEEVEWSNVIPISAKEIMEIREVNIKPYVWFSLMDWFIIDED